MLGSEDGLHCPVKYLLGWETCAEGQRKGDVQDHGQSVFEVDVPGEALAEGIDVVVGCGVFEFEPEGWDYLGFQAIVELSRKV